MDQNVLNKSKNVCKIGETIICSIFNNRKSSKFDKPADHLLARGVILNDCVTDTECQNLTDFEIKAFYVVCVNVYILGEDGCDTETVIWSFYRSFGSI
jgi:hypothetical protein